MPWPVKTAFGKSLVRRIPAKHQSGDAGDVRMERHSRQIEHQSDMFIERCGNAEGNVFTRRLHGCFLRQLKPSFDLPDVVEIALQFDAIAGAQFVAKRSNVAHDLVENAAVDLYSGSAFLRSTAVAEQALEDAPRVDLMRQ